jgi:hypothetical protein
MDNMCLGRAYIPGPKFEKSKILGYNYSRKSGVSPKEYDVI